MRLKADKKGFTFLEIIIVITIMGIIALVGFRVFSTNEEAVKFQETINRLDEIAKKTFGDPRLFQAGRRIDWGYWGLNGTIPNDLDLLDNIRPAVDPNYYSQDAWGNSYSISPSALNVSSAIKSISSLGTSRSAPFNQSINIVLPWEVYRDNTVDIFVKDVRGTLLLPVRNGMSGTSDFHLIGMTFVNSTQNLSYDSGSASNTLVASSSFYTAMNVRAGVCTVTVEIANGAAADDSTSDWRPNLSPGGIDYTVVDVIYPKMYGLTHNRLNVLEIRVPGSVQGGPTIP